MGRRKITIPDNVVENKRLRAEKIREYQQQSRDRKTVNLLEEKNQRSYDESSTEINSRQFIIHGSFHQGDARFSQFSRGKQCTANAAVSISMSISNPVTSWTSDTIDTILNYGNRLYIDSIAKRRVAHKNDDYISYLSVSELKKKITMLSVDYYLTFGAIIFGHLFDDNNDIGMPNLKNGLLRLFIESDSGILTCNGISISVGKYHDKFWVFDSHSRGLDGRVDCNGAACVATFHSIESLWSLLIDNIPKIIDRAGNQYDLTPITVHLDTNRIQSQNHRQNSNDLNSASPNENKSDLDNGQSLTIHRKPREITFSDSTEIILRSQSKSHPDVKINSVKGEQFSAGSIRYISKSDKCSSNLSLTHNINDQTRIEKQNHRKTSNYFNSVQLSENKSELGNNQNLTIHSKPREIIFNKSAEIKLRSQLASIPDVTINSVKCQQFRARSKRYTCRTDKCSSNVSSTHNIHEHYIGPMNIVCTMCKAKHFAAEKVSNKNSFNDCCSHGDVILEKMPNPPDELLSLFENNHMKSRSFFDRIRSYNSTVSFASFNANLVNFGERRPGPYCFKIQGQIYYQVNTALYPEVNERPSYGQLFIVDAKEATEHRLRTNSALDYELLHIVDRIIRKHNIFAHSYQMMSEEIQNQQQLMNQNHEVLPEMQLLFSLKPGMDRRRYNFQRCNEVAAVFSTTADGEIPESFVTIRNKNTKILTNVNTMDPNVEPWIYPLFYPHGTQGWHRNLMRIGRCGSTAKRVSRAAYLKYRMAIRDHELNIFVLGRRLFQQWLVDSYVKIEKDRIEYCKSHQKELRAESYQGLIDFLERKANNLNGRVGKIVILPSTFVGSPRNMMQSYQDAMAIVRKYGKPDLFITMTCNPKWREIKENLLINQEAADRPDICARVFNAKKDYLVDLIVRQRFFGEVAAHVYVIEFQKRGLPHIHMLVTLKRNYKLTTPEIVDKYISAEIPDPTINKKLHDIVMKHMIHGPCGDWCLENGKCTKNFPKQFREVTAMDEDGYPYYRRRELNQTFERPNRYFVDNRYVVPHSPKLLIVFDCHINVEVVSSIRSVKYFYKYVYKGSDAAAITIGENLDQASVVDHDEIRDFIEARYVGPVEASWRIFGKILQHKSHTIIRLPVHLQNEQSIVFSDDRDESTVISALEKIDMLIDYFALNSRDEQARQYYYTEIPCFYTFKTYKIDGKIIHRWVTRRSQFNCIGRMYSVSPTQLELFHLRLLLLAIKGAKSYEELKTVNGTVQQTFTDACLALGLIEDDEEWKRTMNEASIWMMPRQLRNLFIRILIHCQPVNPRNLWEEFKNEMSEDFARYVNLSQRYIRAYANIGAMLLAEGRNLSDFHEMEQSVDELEEDNEYPDQFREIGEKQYQQLNEEQRGLVDAVLYSLNTENPNRETCFYIDGPGGSGKTYVYTNIWYLLKARAKKVITMAFTGIAANLLPQGKTVHKTFGLPVPLFADSSSNIKIQSKEGEKLKEVDVLIWDEATMSPRYALEVIDRTLRDIMNNDIPFGGKIIILGGDFRQLLPVRIRATRSETINLSIKFSILWKHFKKFSLNRNMRVLAQEVEFSKFLIDLGDGKLNDQDDNITFPERCIANFDSNIVNIIYGDYIKEKRYKEASKCAILSARNVDVDEINQKVVELLDSKDEKIYTSINSIENPVNNETIGETILTEYLATLSPPALPPHELRLRKYSIVMIIRNLSIHEGLCSGTRLLVLELGNHLLKCEILTGDNSGQIIFLNRITLYCEDVYPFTFKRRQFPIKLAFAMTINKSQGQTFERIGVDLRKDVFNHGQLYVACSRVRSWDALKVFTGEQRKGDKIKNFVYKELYADIQ